MWSFALTFLRITVKQVWACNCIYPIHYTAWKVSKYGVFSGPYFPVCGLNSERYFVSLRIQSECGKIRTRKSSVSGRISYSVTSFEDWCDLAIFSLAGKIPRWMERLKACNSGISKVPKHLLRILKLISSNPALLFVFKAKNASLSSLIETAFEE